MSINESSSYHAEKRMIAGQNVSITVDLSNMDVDNLESIAFRILPGPSSSEETVLIFSIDEIKNLLATSDTSVLTLSLRHQYDVRIEETQSVDVRMEITSVANSLPQTDSGHIELLYLDLSTFQIDDNDDDPSQKVHLPFIWSIDVAQRKDQAATNASTQSPTVSHYAVSGNGNFVLTLSVQDESLQLDLWDLELDSIPAVVVTDAKDAAMDTDTFNEHRAPFLPKPRGQVLVPLSQSLTQNRPRNQWNVVLPYLDLVDASLTVSISWDGSQIVLMSGTREYLTEPFQAYINMSMETTLEKKVSTLDTLKPITQDQTCVQLKGYCGFGRFHFTTTTGQNLEDELLITCDGKTVDIYTVFGTWCQIRTIEFSVSDPIPLINSLCGKYFAWSSENTVLICDLESGRASIQCRHPQHLQSAGTHGQYLYVSDGSKLELTRLKDVTVPPYLQPRYQCDDRCFNKLTLIEPVDELFGDSNEGPLPSGLTFAVQYLPTGTGQWREFAPRAVLVTVSDSQGNSREALMIPPTDIDTRTVFQYDVSFDLKNLQMIVFTSYYVMVWRVPTTLDEDFALLSTWWTVPHPFQPRNENRDFLNELAHCAHGYRYLRVLQRRKLISVLRLHSDDAFEPEPSRFLDGLLTLILMFKAGKDDFRQHVLKYVGHYINRFVEHDGQSDTVMTKICRHVSQENHALYEAFLRALLDSPHGRWVPRPGLKGEANPIWVLLNRGHNVPRATDIAQIVIDYCIRMAKHEKDHHFLSPVMNALEKLISFQSDRPNIVLETLQKLAYIPVRERSYIIDHAIIAHPPEFPLPFRKPSARLLHQCENPVLHLDRKPLIKEPNPQNDNFTRNLFVASFDMLWHVSGNKPDTRSSIARIAAGRPPQSWIRTLFHAILLQCKLTTGTTVECYDFALESLDNPAIAALIEYKWNTIGYTYWLIRFLWQCLYYILVLVAVFAQVYSEQQQSLKGVFITIIAMAAVSLWLEVLQAISSGLLHYLMSPYNWVDVAVFALPLAGSVCQLFNIANESVDYNTSSLSFSVLFVFLHCLFELRVNKRVCQFVTIIVRIFAGIRVFFFVFIAGLVAFAIAIMHLLRACPFGTCDYSEVKFPDHLFSAISSTYFFMGGIWDPVSDNFGTKNWAFEIMMIFYFFFTTILLLNVLIALINNSFNTGDETWRLVWVQNRMRYVASAESMTYDIP
ncbi:hypothetical protein BGZ65_001781, partial [Modicella reniformis]